jgi:hypothetical protein
MAAFQASGAGKHPDFACKATSECLPEMHDPEEQLTFPDIDKETAP